MTGYEGLDTRWYQDILERAIARHGVPRGVPSGSLRDLNRHVAGNLGYMQPSASLYWQAYLYHAFLDSEVFDRPDIYTVTVIDQRWHFGEHEWNFQPNKIQYQVRRALKGLNYLVMIEFEVFGNKRDNPYRARWPGSQTFRNVEYFR